ncbi:MAG: archaellin/type IV pilin N-terminal domain-containing protein [Nanoarchaeota archaeon]
MFKKGVSPVVATVLLIVIVVVLAAIIFIWARGFLSESATKGDRVVESSCEDVRFEVQIALTASQCTGSAIDINNIGNIPIYGAKVLQYDDATGSVEVIDQAFNGGTVKVGMSSYACLGFTVNSGDKFRVIPKLLAEKEERKIAYTCPEKDGQTVVY